MVPCGVRMAYVKGCEAMRIAIISDIHGNCVALDAVLADQRARAPDQVICLGDAIQGGPQPAETVARLRELDCPVVMGNADAWLLTGLNTSPTEAITERQRAVREWSLARLTDADRAFIAAFAPTVTLDLGGRRLRCFHGSPSSFDDIIFPETAHDEALRLFGLDGDADTRNVDILAGGHTHTQQIRRLGQGFFFNPGSVGLSYSHHQPAGVFRADPWAEYAILTVEDGDGEGDGRALALEFRRVPFDLDALLHAYRAGDRPDTEAALAQYGV